MQRAILFRFHKEPEICAERIRILKHFNPEVPIYGLGEDIEGIEEMKAAGLEHLYVIEDETSEWKWKNGDLAVRRWFREFGKNREFDFLHIIEWDLLVTSSLSDLYDTEPEEELFLTGLKPIQDAVDYGWPWVTEEPNKQEWERLKSKVSEDLDFENESYGCIFPGAGLPREFLEKFSEFEVSELVNDEVRVPLYAQALGFQLKDTGFFPKWGDEKLYRYFNAKGQEIKLSRIEEQLSKPDGRRAFHPVRQKIGLQKILELKE